MDSDRDVKRDDDLERWREHDWRNFELWEKIEPQLRRRRRIWISAVGLIFVLISAVPVVMDGWPKWKASMYARRLTVQLNQVRRRASLDQVAYRLRFPGEPALEYVIERSPGCGPAEEVIERGEVGPGDAGIAIVAEDASGALGIPGLVAEYCYDPLQGSQRPEGRRDLRAFALGPVNDLTDARVDRLSFVSIEGESLSFQF